jgi:hypothetical protein
MNRTFAKAILVAWGMLGAAVAAQERPHAPPAGPVDPAQAKAVIQTWKREDVPKVWPAGVPIDLTSAGSNAGDKLQSIRWECWPDWVDKYSHRSPDGRTISVATGVKSKTVRITLYVAKDDTFDMTSVTVAIRPDPLEPGDGGRPEPVPPEPAVPLSAFAQQVKDLAIRDIPDVTRRKTQVWALATSHEQVAAAVSQAVAGVPAYAYLNQPQAIIDATVASNQAAVGGDREVYVPFFTSLNGLLKPMSTTTLSTAGGHIGVWQDIAHGLRAAAP